MNKNITQKALKCQNLLSNSISTLYSAQAEFDISEFSLRIIEILMNLERKEYQKELSSIGKIDIGNGNYPRHFSCLSNKDLLIQYQEQEVVNLALYY